ncbi:MAG: hypothetical protein HDR88_02295 [Bacteroides sp.]|nr:hypothetical protein [Bacteroides sp.]
MDTNKTYIVSFGDSDSYSVTFNGSRDQLLHSDNFRKIVDDLKDCLKKDFPAGNYDELISPKIREANPTDKGYAELTPDAVRQIMHTLKREGEVLNANRRLDSDAPYSNI